jgi:rhomboid family GlyGly-CTERM serine protease
MPVPSRSLHPALAWVALCAGLAIAAVLGFAIGNSWQFSWHADLWTRHPWMLWSASLVHLGSLHLFGNLLALGVLAALGAHLRANARDVLAVLLAWPLGNAALALWPAVSGYQGLSGLLCAMLAVLTLRAAREPGKRFEAVLLAALLAFKLASERAWAVPIAYDPDWGINVVRAAHLAGAAAGLGSALWLQLASRLATARRSAPSA